MADSVEIQQMIPQVSAPTNAAYDQHGNQVPGPPPTAFAAIGTVNGDGPFVAHIPAGQYQRTQEPGYRGPGFHQIVAAALAEAAARGYFVAPFERLLGMSVDISPNMKLEPLPEAQSTSGADAGSPDSGQPEPQQSRGFLGQRS